MIDQFSELCEARILIGSCVSEAETLFEALLDEAQQLTGGEDKEFVLAGLNEPHVLGALAHVIAVNRSGGEPNVVRFATSHDTQNHIAYLSGTGAVLLDCNPKAWETAAAMNICTAAWETIKLADETRERILRLIKQIGESALIETVHVARVASMTTLTRQVLQCRERSIEVIEGDSILLQAAVHGLDSLPLLELNKLVNDRKRLQQLAGIIKSRDDSNGGTRHQSWDTAMLDLITDNDPRTVL